MTLRWYFDFVSPFAYLHWPRVRALAEAQSVEFRPILFAGLLDRHEHKGPAEIPAKRLFTYRHVLWKAQQQGRALRFPPGHPFNPVAALRLCIAAGTTPRAIEAIFEWIWAQGHAGDSAQALRPLAESLGITDIEAAIAAPEVKAQLRDNFEAALAEGVFGVPTLSIDGTLFWGEDAHFFAEAALANPGLLTSGEYARLLDLPMSASRTA